MMRPESVPTLQPRSSRQTWSYFTLDRGRLAWCVRCIPQTPLLWSALFEDCPPPVEAVTSLRTSPIPASAARHR